MDLNRSNAVAHRAWDFGYICRWILSFASGFCFHASVSAFLLARTSELKKNRLTSIHPTAWKTPHTHTKKGSSSVLNPALVQLLPEILRQFHSHSFSHCHLINFSLSDMIIAHEFVTYMPCISRELPRTIQSPSFHPCYPIGQSFIFRLLNILLPMITSPKPRGTASDTCPADRRR